MVRGALLCYVIWPMISARLEPFVHVAGEVEPEVTLVLDERVGIRGVTEVPPPYASWQAVSTSTGAKGHPGCSDPPGAPAG